MFGKRSVSFVSSVSVFATAATVAMLGCNSPKSPPSLPVPSVSPVSIPLPAAPKDPELFGYVKLRDPVQLLNMALGPTAAMMASAQGINLGEMKAGQSATAFVWDLQGASMDNLPIAGLLPVPATGTVVKKLTTSVPSSSAAPQGESTTLVTMSASAQQRAAAGAAALKEIADAKLPFDGLLYVHVEPILAKYGPVLRSSIKAMEPMMAMAGAKQPGAPSAAATSAMLENMVGGLESLKSIGLGAEMKDSGLDVSILVEDKKASDKGGPMAAPDLAQFLAPGDARLQWNIRDLKKTVDTYLKLYDGMLKENPEVAKQVYALIEEWEKASPRSDSAMTMSLGGEKGFRFQGIMRVDNPKQVFDLMRKTTGLFSQGPIHEAYKKLGIDLSIAGQQNARKIRGWTVDRYTYKFVAGDKVLPAQKAIYDKFNGATYEVAQVGPYMVYAMNASLDEVVEALFTGAGKYPLAAAKGFPAGGTFYGDFDVASLMAAFKGFMPAGQADRMPTLPAGSGLLTAFAYDGGGTGYIKLNVPKPLLGAIAAAAK